MLYENRQSQIVTINYKITKTTTKVLYYLVNYLVPMTVLSVFYMDETDQIEMKKIVLARIPCPTIEFFNQNTYVLLKGGETAPFYAITISALMIVGQVFFYAGRSIYHLVFVTNSKLSQSTRKLQRQYLAAVTVQVSIPTIVIVLPITYSLYSDKTNYYNQAYNNNLMCLMGTHGVLSAVATLLIFRPYREFCTRLLTCGTNKVRASLSSAPSLDMMTKQEGN